MKEIDWANLSFGYMKTDYNVRCYYRDGAWGAVSYTHLIIFIEIGTFMFQFLMNQVSGLSIL